MADARQGVAAQLLLDEGESAGLGLPYARVGHSLRVLCHTATNSNTQAASVFALRQDVWIGKARILSL